MSTPKLRAGLVVLDLRELEFMDTCGVHAIVDASIRSARRGDGGAEIAPI